MRYAFCNLSPRRVRDEGWISLDGFNRTACRLYSESLFKSVYFLKASRMAFIRP
jgi:hypothetical protein